MIDVSIAYDRYKFLGHEFLTWLLFKIEEQETDLEVGSKVVFEKTVDESVERITINGDEAGLEEGKIALSKGSKVTEIELVFKSGEYQWRFTIQGESFNFKGLKAPSTESLKNKDEYEGAILEKHYLNTKVMDYIKSKYKEFLGLRISNDWWVVAKNLSHWISAKG
ncbi:MAG: hypothetical protein GY760_14050 [Deltaproteobacteria bacterium]|nr:hypothetical protein [Deltaproteobacteria bacterium]